MGVKIRTFHQFTCDGTCKTPPVDVKVEPEDGFVPNGWKWVWVSVVFDRGSYKLYCPECLAKLPKKGS